VRGAMSVPSPTKTTSYGYEVTRDAKGPSAGYKYAVTRDAAPPTAFEIVRETRTERTRLGVESQEFEREIAEARQALNEKLAAHPEVLLAELEARDEEEQARVTTVQDPDRIRILEPPLAFTGYVVDNLGTTATNLGVGLVALPVGVLGGIGHLGNLTYDFAFKHGFTVYEFEPRSGRSDPATGRPRKVQLGPISGLSHLVGTGMIQAGKGVCGAGCLIGRPLQAMGRVLRGATDREDKPYATWSIKGYGHGLEDATLQVGPGVDHGVSYASGAGDKAFHTTLAPFIAIDVIVPPDAAAGDVMQVETPSGWLNVQVPQSVKEGDVFRVAVQVPTVTPGAAPSHGMLPDTRAPPWRTGASGDDETGDSQAAVLWDPQSWAEAREF